MGGAALFRHQAEDRAIFLDDIVGRDLGGRVAQAIDGFLARAHAGVVQDQHVDGDRIGARVVVRAGKVAGDHGRGESRSPGGRRHQIPRSRLMRSQAALISATFAEARFTNSSGTPREARLSGWFSRINCFQAARTCSSEASRVSPSAA